MGTMKTVRSSAMIPTAMSQIWDSEKRDTVSGLAVRESGAVGSVREQEREGDVSACAGSRTVPPGRGSARGSPVYWGLPVCDSGAGTYALLPTAAPRYARPMSRHLSV